jgi:hypothetical protein
MWPFRGNDSSIAAEEPPADVETAETPVSVAQSEVAFPSSGPAKIPKLSEEEMTEYIRVSAEIGIDCCTDLTRERLLRCFKEENIHVFNRDQVIEYLDKKLGTDWEWRGLRQMDAKHLAGWFESKTDTHRQINFAKEPYRGAVPLPVLMTVQKIQKAVPNDVYFYISAPKENDGDPFLCVTSRWLGVYIIERWNEPNFRER